MSANPFYGDWRGLDRNEQAPRYRAIAGMVERYGRGGHRYVSVLDVGCGQGLLRRFLPSMDYLGVDPSAIAVATAPGGVVIECATAEKFESERKWNAIVFNEVLYYLADPAAVMAKYAAMLAQPNGVIIISIYQRSQVGLKARLRHWLNRKRPMGNVHCWEMAHRHMAREGWRVMEAVEIKNVEGREPWRVCVVRPSVIPANKIEIIS